MTTIKCSFPTAISSRPSPGALGCGWWTPETPFSQAAAPRWLSLRSSNRSRLCSTCRRTICAQVQTQLKGGHTLEVDAFDRANEKQIEAGKLTSLDNEVDTTTGTIKFRADVSQQESLALSQPVCKRAPAGEDVAQASRWSRQPRCSTTAPRRSYTLSTPAKR